MKCEICGSNKIIKQNGSFVCQTCGIGYSLEEIKKMMLGDQVPDDGADEESKENGIELSLHVDDLVFFGEYPFYPDDDTKYHIDWIIVEETEENFLLRSKYLIDCVQFNTTDAQRTDIPPILNSRGEYRYVWHNSSIREWLNSAFLEIAFDEEERHALMMKVTSFPEYIEEQETEFGVFKNKREALPDTRDKVFLPTEEEAFAAWSFSPISWAGKTPYAKNKAQGLNIDKSSEKFWNLTPYIFDSLEDAQLSGDGGCYCNTTQYAYLRPMVLVRKKLIYDIIDAYTDEFFDYYVRCFNEHRDKIQEERKNLGFVRNKTKKR